MVGVIEVADQEEHNVVSVEFHDRSLRKGFHWSDTLKFDMASLGMLTNGLGLDFEADLTRHYFFTGERGAAFACPPQDAHPAQVTFKPYGSSPDWTYTLPERGSRVRGLAVGGTRPSDVDDFKDGLGMVVIATSENDLTFITGEKQEMFVMGLDGDFVTMTAGPEWVCVIHRPGAATIDGNVKL